MRTVALLLALAAAPFAALPADELHLADGRIIEGEELPSDQPGVVLFQAHAGGISAVIRVKTSEVVKLVHGPSKRQMALARIESRRRDLGEGGSAAEWWAVAEQARGAGETVLAKELAGEVLARDRDHAEARRFLGHQQVNGVWMRANEAAVARGLVWHQGQWMTWLGREAVLADEARKREEAIRSQREAEALLAARREAQAAVPAVTPPSAVIWNQPGYGINGHGHGYGCGLRSVLWPGAMPYAWYQQPVLDLTASGGGSHHRWNIHWRW